MQPVFYSVDQIADRLGLHVRTVRGYVREGRLKAVRIGKQYRINKEDLEAFTGTPIQDPEPIRRERYVEVSCIVEIDAISPDDASRITNGLLATAKGLRVETIYNQERARLKIILTGGLDAASAMLGLIHLYTQRVYTQR